MPRVGCMVILVMLAACTDPIDRPGTWNASAKSNDANLRVMVADPHDLVEGKGHDGSSSGAEAAPAVTRLLTGRRYPLPSSDTSDLQSGPQSAPPPPPPQ
jgi:hypothetical protein